MSQPGRVSALYEGWVWHRHAGSVDHHFRARATMVQLDLAEIDEVMATMPLWSATGPAPVRFRRADYLDGTDRPLADALGDLVEGRLGRRPQGPVRILTQLRRLGWVFNPLTVYWCDRPEGGPDAVVLEVTNTPWHERHWYVLEPPGGDGATDPFAKELHVSPFLPMGLTYRLLLDPKPGTGPSPAWSAHPPTLAFELEARQNTEAVFGARLVLDRIELTPGHAVASLLRRPLATVGVSAAIRGQALALAARRAPFHHHPDGRATPVAARR